MNSILAILFMITHSIVYISAKDCSLVSLSPASGPLSGMTRITLSIRHDSTFINASHYRLLSSSLGVDSTLALTWLSTMNSPTSNVSSSEYLIITPWMNSHGMFIVSVDDCDNLLLYTFYNATDVKVDIPSTQLRITGGSSIEVKLFETSIKPFAINTLVVRLSSVNTFVEYTLSKDFQLKLVSDTDPQSFFVTTDQKLSAFDAGTIVSISLSLNEQDFSQTEYSAIIAESSPLRVLFVYDNYVTDLGWNAAHNVAKLVVASYFGVATDIDFLEALLIYDSKSGMGVLGPLLDSGKYDVFIVCADVDPIADFEERYPNIIYASRSNAFSISSPTKAKNVMYYSSFLYGARYLNGIVAGSMIAPGGSICFLNNMRSTVGITDINSFATGVFKFNPTAQFKLLTINAFGDLFLERGGAQYLFDLGCDAISGNTDHPETMRVFTSNGRYGFGAFSSSRGVYGENVLDTAEYVWAPIYFEIIQKALDGTLTNAGIVKGFLEGTAVASDISGNVDEISRRRLKSETSALMSKGQQNYLLCGPMFDTAGLLQIPEGRCANHTDLQDLKWIRSGIIDLGVYNPVPPVFDDMAPPQLLVDGLYSVFAIFIAFASGIGAFLIYYRDHTAIKFAQLQFLCPALFGCCVGVSSILLIAQYPRISDEDAYMIGGELETSVSLPGNITCQLIPWSLVISWALIFPALFAKTHRQHVVLAAAVSMQRIVRSRSWYIIPFTFTMCLSVFPIFFWQIYDPMTWSVRIVSRDQYGHPVSAYGSCISADAYKYLTPLSTFICIILSYGYYICEQSRFDEDLNHESEKIIQLIWSFSGIIVVAVILTNLVYTSPIARAAVFSVGVTFAFGAVLHIIFLPKVILVLFPNKGVFIVDGDALLQSAPGSKAVNKSGGKAKLDQVSSKPIRVVASSDITK